MQVADGHETHSDELSGVATVGGTRDYELINTQITSRDIPPAYDVILYLVIHVQLETRSNLFCRSSTKFGAPPTTQPCTVCIGMPGALPVMNRQAFQLALKTAVALNCEIPQFTKWDRKNYYYP